MNLTKLLTASAVASALALAGCTGDIKINEGDEVVVDPGPGPGPDPDPGSFCPDFATEINAIGSFSQVCELNEDYTFTSNQTLTNDILWLLNGRVAVGNDNEDPATLTIQAGTTVIGNEGDDFLVVRRGSQINASGTQGSPIVFTSFEDVNGDETGIGQWGGLVLLGNAPANLCDGNGDFDTDATELANCGIAAEGDAGLYGGDDPNDNSGTLRYVVVKHAGNSLAAGDELNGITFAGVGDATTVEYIQVHENLDDGVEFFGGSVNIKHVVLTGNGDDSLDWAFGWSGRAQFVYIQHNDTAGNRAFESDNSEDFPLTAPVSDPMVSNVTVVGGNVPDEDSEGILLRHGTAGRLHNIVVTGPSGMGECLEVDSFPETRANAESGDLIITHSVVACDNAENFKGTATTGGLSTEDWFLGQTGNAAYNGSAALNLAANGYQPLVGSPLLGAGIDASTVDSWFESTDYIGAFDGTTDWTEGWTVGVRGGFPADIQNAFERGLASNVSSEFPQITDKPVYRLSNGTTFTEDTTLTNDAHWILDGRIAVGNDNTNNTTLYVQQGTTLIGETGDDFLVVRRGSKLEAIGSVGAPIIMTSIQDVIGQETGIGQWGGLVLLGKAPSNLCDGNGDNVADATELANCGIAAEGDAGLYGGDDPEDNSGTLKFVVVKYAGKALAAGDELNGISFAGVGRGTTVDYIQVHENLDDGVEFFGGTVDVRHVVLTGNGDDSFDWAFGWTGRAQYVYIQHNDTLANRGFESDNSEDFPAATPLTSPTVSNVTIIGNNAPGGDSEGVLLRHGTAGVLRNFVITGPAGMGECLEVDGFAETQANAESGALIMTHSVVACENGENFKGTATTGGLTTEAWFLGQAGNSAFTDSSALNLLSDGFTPRSGSPLLGAGYDVSADDNWFQPTNFIGAFNGQDNWMDGWTYGVNSGVPGNVPSASDRGLATDASSSFPQITDKPVYRLGADTVFTQDTVLTNDKHWVLQGRTAVGNDNADSATLYIEPGTIIFGESGDDFMVVRRGSKLEALGSATAPIIMTSVQDVTGQATDIGQWGGLVLLGNAPVNLCDGNGDFNADATELANCGIAAEGDAGLYGGDDPEDNSGTLRYLVVKYAGKALAAGDELNGISFAGVGRGTTVDYIQVHKNLDDGVEFFGGTVDVKHLVLTANGDDSFDWAFGWIGRAQYVLIKHDASFANRGIEGDNSEDFPQTTPVTNPIVANFTIIGANNVDSEGVLLRHGTAGELYNFIITGPAGMGECLEVDSFAETQANAESGALIMENSVVACENGENFKGIATTGGLTTEAWFLAQTGNAVIANQAGAVTNYVTATTTAARDMNAIDSWFDTVDFVGAVGSDNDWTAGWITVGL
ncbi:MAG: hypothetical protein HWE27_03740 [Gammaproteobacteria bacterium]|nr:hypothetical protein [Gammaproteobacteria bacterium]